MSDRPGQGTSARTILTLIVIALLAAGLRVGAIAYTHATHAPAEENRIIARYVAAGRGFTFTEFTVTGPTAIRGPVYPMLLAIVGPDRMGVILGLNVLIGAATVFAAYSLTKRLLSPSPLEGEGWGEGFAGLLQPGSHSKSTSTADPSPYPLPQGEGGKSAIFAKTTFAPILAAVLFAVWPTQVYAATLSQGLSLAVFLTLASLTFAFRRSPASLIAAGLLAGLAVLTEPVLAMPLLLCAIVLGWRDVNRRWHSQDAGVFVIAAMLLIAPWLYRNAIVFGRPMPITSNFWRDAFLGNGDDIVSGGIDVSRNSDAKANASLRETNRITRLPPREFDRLKVTEAKRIDVFREWSLTWIRSDPGRYLRLCFERFNGFAPSSHPLSRHWLYFSFATAEMIGLVVLLLFRQDRRAIQWIALFMAIQAVLVANVVLTRGDARLSVFRSANFLIATAVAVALIAERKTSSPNA